MLSYAGVGRAAGGLLAAARGGGGGAGDGEPVRGAGRVAHQRPRPRPRPRDGEAATCPVSTAVLAHVYTRHLSVSWHAV